MRQVALAFDNVVGAGFGFDRVNVRARFSRRNSVLTRGTSSFRSEARSASCASTHAVRSPTSTLAAALVDRSNSRFELRDRPLAVGDGLQDGRRRGREPPSSAETRFWSLRFSCSSSLRSL